MFESSSCGPFDVIVVTSGTSDQSNLFQHWITLRQQGSPPLIDPSIPVLAVSDPGGIRVGSGGATLNALNEAVLYLRGKGVSDVVANRRILILHSGGNAKRVPIFSVVGKAFSELPSESSSGDRLFAPIDFLLARLTAIFTDSPRRNGVIVAATDVLLLLPDIKHVRLGDSGISGVGIRSSVRLGSKHGVFCVNSNGDVVDFVQKGSKEVLEARGAIMQDDTVLLDSGIIWFAPDIAEKYLDLIKSSPGLLTTRFELYSDMLCCLNPSIKYAEYLNMSAENGISEGLLNCRKVFWDQLRSFPFSAADVPGARFAHLGTLIEYLDIATRDSVFRPALSLSRRAHCSVGTGCKLDDSATVINSVLTGFGTIQNNSVVEHSLLDGKFEIGEECIVSGIRPSMCGDLVLKKGLCIQQLSLPTGSAIFLVGIYDEPKSDKTFLNYPISTFFERTGISEDDLWPDEESRSMWNAKLYTRVTEGGLISDHLWMQDVEKPPSKAIVERWRSSQRYSLQDLTSLSEPLMELQHRRQMSLKIDMETIRASFSQNLREENLYKIVKRYARDEDAIHKELLLGLDNLAGEITRSSNPQSLCRLFALIADTVKLFYEKFKSARQNSTSKAPLKNFNIQRLFDRHPNWLASYIFVNFVYHYYMSKSLSVIRSCVETSDCSYKSTRPSEFGEWITIESPVRLDLAGGWTDTPPVCYVRGGMVVNVGVLLDGKRPIGSRARRIEEKCIRLSGQNRENLLEMWQLSSFRGYNEPHMPFALLKSALVTMKIVDVDSNVSLTEQLKFGIEIETWSDVPRGSGLGTSSILAAAIVKVISRVIGRDYSPRTLIHTAQVVEQVLTTGGGFQDQVGGLYGGFKVSSCHPRLPLEVETEVIRVSQEFIQLFNSRLVLVYTGVQRLAKNLLIDVIRRFLRADMISIFDDLLTNSEECATAVREGNIERLGACLGKYWQQKQRITENAAPDIVRSISRKLAKVSVGLCLGGAGGGGFMTVLTSSPEITTSNIEELLQDEISSHGVSVHSGQIDFRGMVFR